MKRVLAIDIGASGGRAMIGTLRDGKIDMEEIHRFPNEPVTVLGHTYWDILSLFREVKIAIKKAGDIDSVGIDTWGVDYGMIDKYGNLIANPHHYRDTRTAHAKKLDIYGETGTQFMCFNTVYQLMCEDFDEVSKILLIPDLLAYFLTGEMRMEYTNASTTNLTDAHTHNISHTVLNKIKVDSTLFPQMIRPGEVYGYITREICSELPCKSVPVIAVGTHDTASAVISVPASLHDEDFAYISSGTWSLFGTLTEKPLVNAESEKLNFTNELGVDFSTRLLKNIMGLWLMQEVRKEYGVTFSELSDAARGAKGFKYIIDPDSDEFLGMGNMTERIKKALHTESLSMGEIARCIYDSLGLKYRYTLENLQKLTGKQYKKLYMFGGGIRDRMLCETTAAACGIPVIACHEEATVLGNIAVQVADDISHIPQIMKNSINTVVYEKSRTKEWENAYERAKQLFCK
ncbi:MAG: rhamnulokinase [Clostridia bacterium]|nr:rhamnulokinase [Clostridia bacterium]